MRQPMVCARGVDLADTRKSCETAYSCDYWGRKDAAMASSTIERGQEVARSMAETPILLWVRTTDHKRIGLMYIYTAFIFFLLGGIEATIIRTQLAVPDSKLITPSLYNELFTMHAT